MHYRSAWRQVDSKCTTAAAVTKIMLMPEHDQCRPGVVNESFRTSIGLIFRQTDANQGC